MPQIQYPFIDIAVHPAVRAKFAAGEAIALFSKDMGQVLWANGEGARLFGYSDIYDLLDHGPERSGVSFRQLAATARQLETTGDRRGLMMRVNTGFVSQAVSAEVSLVEIRRNEVVVIFSAPVAANSTFNARIAAMLKGFEDPDTHMAVLDDHGAVLVASPGFESLGILPDTSRSLIAAVAKSGDGLIKRPIASAAGYLPAAIGKLSIDPPLNLLFCVETVLGRMDPPQEAFTPVLQSSASALETPPATIDDDVSLAGVDEDLSVPNEPTAALDATPDLPQIQPDQDHAVDEPAAEVPQLVAASPAEQPLAEIDAVTGFETESDIDEVEHEIVLNEGESAEDLDNLATLDGASAAEIDARGATTDDDDVAEAPAIKDEEVGGQLPENLALAADEAEAHAAVETDELYEPEDHAEAEMAEAARDEGESAGDMADLAANDATPEPEAAAEQSQQALVADVSDVTPVASQSTMFAEHTTGGALSQPQFHFRRDARPVRFVWKLDAQGNFAEVSEEFARTVGPRAGDINGMSYRDLNSLFHLDPDNEIGPLLERRDTWSGKTIRWPVEGTDLVVPVDLAALPTYSRNREFDGFRGFGIIRPVDAEQDPHAIGLTLAGHSPDQDTAPHDHQADPVPLTVDPQFSHLHTDESAAGTTPAMTDTAGTDEFQGEVPALKLESNPLASFSEKIIKLEERRAKGRDGLTPSEQNALREIARQLEPFGKRPNEALLNQQDNPPAAGDSTPPTTEAAPPVELAPEPTQAEAPAEPASPEADHTIGIDWDFDFDVENNATAGEPHDNIGLTDSAADQIPLAILIHAGDQLVFANAEFKRFTGYQTLEELEARGGLDALISRGESADATVHVVRVDGSQIPVAARLQSVRYCGAKLLMLTLTPAETLANVEATIAEDQQTARKISALKVEADELRSILETATDGVVVLDIDGRIRSMNRSASALFNFEDSETRGKPFAMLFAHESQKAVQDYLNGLIGHGVASVLNDGREVIGREASGGFIPLFMTMGRMPGSNSYCAVIRDITQWKRSEDELKSAKRSAETANQHKSDFLARVSHEIRTPLNAIIGFSDMIASEHFGPAGHPRYVEYAHDIGRSGRHVLDIVNDLLDISKIEAGEMDLEFSAVGINDCVSEAVSLVQPQANAQRVIIRTSLSQSVPAVVADLRSIKQIAINILANAIRFTPSGGQIVVSTAYEPNGSVTLRIRDTGVGMSRADLEQAMKPFGQVHPGARHRGDGTGLGLPLTRAMTEANRAMFSIQSAPNEGTLVEITFPPQRVLAD